MGTAKIMAATMLRTPTSSHDIDALPAEMRAADTPPVRAFTLLDPFLIAACSIFLCCVALAHPFANSGFNDDWSYSDVALRMAQTGHLHYNGWGSPTLLFQAFWGAAWIRLFGFSFDALRVSTLIFALGVITIVYALGLKVGLTRQLALFAALVVGTSPIFLPLAASFMTDVYGAFFTTCCVYAGLECVQSQDSEVANRWLWVLAAAGAIGGINRQIVWVAPLALIALSGWRRRTDRVFLGNAIMTFTGVVIALTAVQLRFSQPYVPLNMSVQQLKANAPWMVVTAAVLMWSAFLKLALLSVPVLLFITPVWKHLGTQRWAVWIAVCFAVGVLQAGFLGPKFGLAPFLGNIVTAHGIMNPEEDALGFRPATIPSQLRLPLGVVALLVPAVCMMLGRPHWKAAAPAMREIFVIFGFAYILLLVPGALTGLSYDRYLLPLFPLAVITVLAVFQPQIRHTPWTAWLTLVLLAGYSVATTHDYYCGLRARDAAAAKLQHMGVVRTEITAGFAFDGWTQLRTIGRIAPSAYREKFDHNATDKFWFWSKTTALDPRYVIAYCRPDALPEHSIARIPFSAWLPPFNRTIVVLSRSDLSLSSSLACLAPSHDDKD